MGHATQVGFPIFMTIQFPEDPLTHIKTWQTLFKKTRQQSEVFKMNTSEVTKESHEKLHIVKNATDHIQDWRTFWADVLKDEDPSALAKAKEETIKDFLDTISCALEGMSGTEVFDCFIQAVENEMEYKQSECKRITELFNLLLQPK